MGDKIRHAAALVVGTPNYRGNISGPLKSLFGRNVTVFEYVGPRFSFTEKEGQERSNRDSLLRILALLSSWVSSRGAIYVMKTVLKSGGYRIISTLVVPNTVNIPKSRRRCWTRPDGSVLNSRSIVFIGVANG